MNVSSLRSILDLAALPRVALLATLCVLPPGAHAASVRYELIALGGDKYRYVYSVANDGSLSAGVSIGLFDVLFDPVLYKETSLSVTTLPALHNDWDELVLGSAPGVPAAYDVLALAGGIAAGSSLGGFAVEFTWLGTGLPGSQPFAIYDPATFDLLEQGITEATLPLPGSRGSAREP